MVIVRSSRIDLDPFQQSGILDVMAKNRFGCRRPADIAHADEQHPDLITHMQLRGSVFIQRHSNCKPNITILPNNYFLTIILGYFTIIPDQFNIKDRSK